MQLIVDPEFKAFIPPLKPEERERLRASLLAEGCRDPIIVWRGIVVDGHNRYEICTEHDIPFATQPLDLPDRQAVLAWMFQHQIGRRNLSPDQITILAVLRGVPHDAANDREARALAEHDPERAAKVLSGQARSIRIAYNAAVRAGKIPGVEPPARKPRAPRGPAELTEPAPPTAKELVQLSRASEKAKHAERNAKMLAERVKLLEDSLEHLRGLDEKPAPPLARRELGSGLREAAGVALLSDLHLETRVLPSPSTFNNAFCLEIADLRMQRAFDAIEWHVQFASEAFKMRDLVLWLGGDIITNHLHDENVETALLGPVSATMFAENLIERGIRQLLDGPCQFESITVVCSVGNHGRTTKTMRAATAAEHSWEFMMYSHLAKTFRAEPRLRWVLNRDSHQFFEAFDFKLHFHHGHEVRYGGGVGGISIPMNKATAQWDKVVACDLHHYGHYHQYLDSGAVTNNGSLIGYDPYAMSVKATPEPPQQAFYALDSKRGKSFRSPLWVSDPGREAEIWAKVSRTYDRASSFASLHG